MFYEGNVRQISVSDSRRVAGRHTLMVVYTTTGNLRTVLYNASNRSACQTVTDPGIAMILLPRGATFKTGRRTKTKEAQNSDELKQTMFHTESARLLSVFYLNLLFLPSGCMLPWWWVLFRAVTGKLAYCCALLPHCAEPPLCS